MNPINRFAWCAIILTILLIVPVQAFRGVEISLPQECAVCLLDGENCAACRCLLRPQMCLVNFPINNPIDAPGDNPVEEPENPVNEPRFIPDAVRWPIPQPAQDQENDNLDRDRDNRFDFEFPKLSFHFPQREIPVEPEQPQPIGMVCPPGQNLELGNICVEPIRIIPNVLVVPARADACTRDVKPQIESIGLTPFEVMPYEETLLVAAVQDECQSRQNVQLAVDIPELSYSRTSMQFNLERSRAQDITVPILVPFDAKPGEYLIKLTLKNPTFHEVEYRYLVVGEEYSIVE